MVLQNKILCMKPKCFCSKIKTKNSRKLSSLTMFGPFLEIMKNLQKMIQLQSRKEDVTIASSHSDSHISEGYIASQSATHGISSFSLELNEENAEGEDVGGMSSERPIGVKKTRLKKS